MSKTGSIYALVDPRDNTNRYVGQTVSTLDARLYQHISTPTSKDSAAWIAELKAAFPAIPRHSGYRIAMAGRCAGPG